VQNGLILRGFLEANIKWRGRDSNPRYATSVKS
jgi:hypothetical protein